MNIKQNLRSQFMRPHGWLGSVAGMILATRPSNIERNDWTLSLLNLRPADRVLEIGFGPGVAIQKAAATVTQGRIVGLDVSEVMLAQASRRNQNLIHEGRGVLTLGDVAALEELAGPFDKIYSVNVFMFWEEPVAVFQLLRRLLSPSGVLATTVQPRGDRVSEQDTIKVAEQISRALHHAGFQQVRQEIRPMKPVAAVCILAAKSGL